MVSSSIAAVAALAVLLAGCVGGPDAAPATEYTLVLIKTGPRTEPLDKDEQAKVFGGHFANMERLARENRLLVAGPFGTDRSDPTLRGIFVFDTADLAAAQVTAIGVNSYLWRATLETLSFMPLNQADSAGGVIVTDWYANPENPNERVKVSVSILDQDLRADALRVAASREVLDGGTWIAAPVQAATVQRLEDIILTKARDLRRSSIG